eukprot:5822873-Pleurochrysis_carterae.AAC.3
MAEHVVHRNKVAALGESTLAKAMVQMIVWRSRKEHSVKNSSFIANTYTRERERTMQKLEGKGRARKEARRRDCTSERKKGGWRQRGREGRRKKRRGEQRKRRK